MKKLHLLVRFNRTLCPPMLRFDRFDDIPKYYCLYVGKYVLSVNFNDQRRKL